MTNEAPDILMERLLLQKARGEVVSAQDRAKLALSMETSGLRSCEHAHAIHAAFLGVPYKEAVKRTATNSTTNEAED